MEEEEEAVDRVEQVVRVAKAVQLHRRDWVQTGRRLFKARWLMQPPMQGALEALELQVEMAGMGVRVDSAVTEG